MKLFGRVANLAAIAFAFASYGVHADVPTAQAEADLGSAIRASIRDAIKGAVARVAHNQVPRSNLATASEHRKASVKKAAGLHDPGTAELVAVHGVLRGAGRDRLSRQSKHVASGEGGRAPILDDLPGLPAHDDDNPFRPVPHLPILEEDLTPVAPLDAITPGIQAQGNENWPLPPNYAKRAVYYSPKEDVPYPFPQSYHGKDPRYWAQEKQYRGRDPAVTIDSSGRHSERTPSEMRNNHLECTASPINWVDSKKFSCRSYAKLQWCSADGREGPGWPINAGTLGDYAVNMVDAAQACCECGGGAQVPVYGAPEIPMKDRRLYAAYDKLPDPPARWFEANFAHAHVPPRPKPPLQARGDELALPIPPVAPNDKVPVEYSRFMNEGFTMASKPDPLGFSVRYYEEDPGSICSPIKPIASSLDRMLYYTPKGLPGVKKLRLPNGMRRPESGLWWAKWTGTVHILKAGKYRFNLGVGFNTQTELKIDGKILRSNGQCKASQDEGTCRAKGCWWHAESGTCWAGSAAGGFRAQAQAMCPADHFRISPVLFGCSRQSGLEDILVPPGGRQTPALVIPRGTKDFKIKTSSASPGIEMQIFDPSTRTPIVDGKSGIVNQQQKAGDYDGLSISYSGQNFGTVPVPGEASLERAFLKGTSAHPTQLTLKSSATTKMSKAKIQYEYGGLSQCLATSAPVGCSPYDAAKGRSAAQHMFSQKTFGSCRDFWLDIKKSYAKDDMIWWYEFEAVWGMAFGKRLADPRDTEFWQIAFRYLDSNVDGLVQLDEFMVGCEALGGGVPGPAVTAASPEQSIKISDSHLVHLKYCTCVEVLPIKQWPNVDPSSVRPEVNALVGRQYRIVDEKDGLYGINVSNAIVDIPKIGVTCISAQAENPYSGSGPAPGPAPAPATSLLQDETELEPDAAVLSEGGHCIEVKVMVTPGAHTLQLSYQGPDTLDNPTVVPGQALFCDPVIPACSQQKINACPIPDQECGSRARRFPIQ